MPVIAQASDERDIHFVLNKGQWPKQVIFEADVHGGQVYFTQQGFRYSFYSPGDLQWLHDHPGGSAAGASISGHVYDVVFAGSKQPGISGGQQKSFHHNYFLGNDPSKWAGNVPVFGGVTYAELYDNIDMQVYSSGTSLKYDFVVKPGGRVEDIQLQFDGVVPILTENGDLKIETSVNTIIEQAPYAYQVIDGEEVEVACEYGIDNGMISFSFPAGYDKSRELVIDPVLIFATYTGSTGDLWAYCSAYDVYGNFYSASEAYHSGFPVTPGAFQTTYLDFDLAINKYNDSGNALMYSTYCGGTGREHPTAMVVNSNNELIVSGQTYSADFPVTPGAYDDTFNATSSRSDIFVTVFNPAGSALVGSTFVGGTGEDGISSFAFHDNDQNKSGLCLDAQDNIYVAATTESKDFPVTPGALQVLPGSSKDGCIFKLSAACSTLIYSTYLGGNLQDCLYDCKPAGAGKLAVCGRSVSTNLPATANAYSDTGNAFVAIINASGSAVVALTRLGAFSESAIKLSLDQSGQVFVCGNNDTGFAVHGATFFQPQGKVFIAKLTPGLDTLLLSTKLVNTAMPGVTGFVNICGDVVGSVYVKGASNLPVSANAYQAAYSSYYFFHLGPAMDTLIYATYFGAPYDPSGHAHGSSAIDTGGIIWLSTCNQLSKHLLHGTAGSYSPTSKSRDSLDNDHLSAKFDMEVLAVKPIAQLQSIDTACAGIDIFFTNLSKNAYKYIWYFGDGDTSHMKNPMHKYDSSGTYIVTLEAYNPHSCKVVDVRLDTLFIDSVIVKAGFVAPDTVCRSATVSMTNLSAKAWNYLWDFGDGSSATTINAKHVYTGAGTYKIKLVAYNPTLCNNSDTFERLIYVDATSPGASFTVDRSPVCVDMPVQFQNQTPRGVTYQWDFDDGTADQSADPAHGFTVWGTRSVRLIATNPLLCVPHDTIYMPVEVKEPLRIELADTFVCGAEPVNWQVNVINANSYITYRWGPAHAILSQTDARSVKVDPEKGTKYYVTVTDSIPGLCAHVASDTGNIIIVPYPEGVYAYSNSPVCARDTLKLEAGAEPAMPGLLFRWMGPDGFSQSGATTLRPLVNSKHAGVYTLEADNHGCSVYQQVEVKVKPVPVVQASSNSPVFEGTALQFTMTTGNPVDSLWWEGPGGFYSKEKNPVISDVREAAAGTYTLSAMADGCLGGSLSHVTVNVPDSQYIHIFPSPNNGTFYIDGKGHNEQEVKLLVINSVGQRLLYTTVLTEKKYFKRKITLPAASGGVYIMYILMDGKFWSVPFTIMRD